MKRAGDTTPPAGEAPASLGRPAVEELPELTWARVERRLWAELDRAPAKQARPATIAPRERRRWPWLAATALAAAAALAVAAWPSSGSRTVVHSPARVATAETASEVSFGDAAITVAPSSAVLMQGQADRGVSIVLERGSATFAVAPRVDRPPFTVLAGSVQVRVVGTRFTVTRSGDDARVDVAHGEVEVVAWGRREVLLAGASWSSDGVREAAVGGSAPVTNPGEVAAAHFSPPAEPAPAEPVPAEPAPAEPPAAAGESAPRRRTPAPATVSPPAPADEVEAAPPATDSTGPLVRPVDDAQALYEEAQRLEGVDPAKAQRLYGRVAAGKSAWAAHATYAAALLAFERGDHRTAAGYADSYLNRFPAGRNAADARALRARLPGAPR